MPETYRLTKRKWGIMDKGWISIHRKIRDCDLVWDDKPFSRGQAWIDLLLMVNHEDKEIMFNGNFTIVKRGETLTSLTKLADRWGWSRKKTTKFLNELKTAQMVDLKSTNKSTAVTVINYDFYQNTGTAKEPQKNRKRTAEEPQRNTNNNISININKENKDIWLLKVEEIIAYLNQKAGKNFKATTEGTRRCIVGRLKDGYEPEDFKRVIDVKCNQWLNDPKMKSYLRPETLFSAQHFESYLNEAPAPKPIPIEVPEEEEPEMTDEEFFALVDSNFGEVG